MRRMKWTVAALTLAIGTLFLNHGVSVDAVRLSRLEPSPEAAKFVIDVAVDGSTWRMNDGTNPFFPHFTGDLSRGNPFIVSGRIYRGGTLAEGGDFGGTNNPAGPETPDAIGTWVCRGTFNLDIAEIAAGGYPHVSSTQIFTFNFRGVIVTEGPEGGAPVLRAVIGGAGRFGTARGDVVETPLGVN